MNILKKNFSQSSLDKKVLSMETINQQLIKAEYSVRGGIVVRSDELRKEMEKGKTVPFKNFVSWNIGNPHSLGQLPITFPREVLSCLYSGSVIGSSSKDVVNRAQTYMKEIQHIENYTHYKGMKLVRDNIAKFITNRDASEANSNDIFLSNGASGGIKAILQILCGDKKDVIMTPIPQYPLYSASIELLGSTLVGYYLDEENQWSVDIKNLQEQYKKYYDSGHRVKAVVVINPGNPTGNILSEDNIKDIIRFCHEHNMIILADEVYQNNIYSESKKFHSFRKVLSKLPSPYNKTTLFSFNSISKGYYGECGLRGGYTDMLNVPDDMKRTAFKLKEIDICPNLAGQISMDLLINPPNKDVCSADTVKLYQQEVKAISDDLKEKALMIYKKLNTIKNFKCNEIEGAMYAFPSIQLPDYIIAKAKESNMHPDYYYCHHLLEATGLVTVPGSGFGQKDGTFHLRLTNLICPKEELLKQLDKIEQFNNFFFH